MIICGEKERESKVSRARLRILGNDAFIDHGMHDLGKTFAAHYSHPQAS